MVDAITAISGSAATSATQVDRSLSITSEPDNKWVAARQSQIDDDLLALKQAKADLQSDILRFEGKADEEMEAAPDQHSAERDGHVRHHALEIEPGDQHATLSGESEEIGTVNFDEDTPFGSRVAIV